MSQTLYVFITMLIAATTIVQINECQDLGAGKNSSRPGRKSIFPVVSADSNDAKFFEEISETADKSTTTTFKPFLVGKRVSVEVRFGEIKGLLSKVMEKIQEMEKEAEPKREIKNDNNEDVPLVDATVSRKNKRGRKCKKKKRKDKLEKRARWGKWTDWSPCSVSCGKGREIRWRHCLENCEVAETEMEEKTCQLPACGPSKLFGVIKLK